MKYEHKTLFLDIETTGLIPHRVVPGKRIGATRKEQFSYEDDYMDFPRIVSIAWAVNDGEVNHYILNQNGLDIPKEASDIHGITSEMANKSTIYFGDGAVLGTLLEEAGGSGVVVGHGLYFDTSIIKANVLREIKNNSLDKRDFDRTTTALHKDKRIDTMRSSAKMCRKWPTLSELHFKLFREGFTCHDAKSDVEATRRCYLWLLQKGIVPTYAELLERSVEKQEKTLTNN